MSEVTGWAIANSVGRIFIKTVSDTRRAAIINYLVTEKSLMVMARHTDEDIENMWAHHGKYALCTPVTVSAQP